MVQRQQTSRQMARQKITRQTFNRVAGKKRQLPQQQFKEELKLKKFITGKILQSDKQLKDLKKFKTFKGSTKSFGLRLFDKQPLYSTISLTTGTIRLPYFVGKYREFLPKTGEIVTRKSTLVRISPRGNPLTKTVTLSKDKLVIPNQQQLDKFQSIAGRWKFAGSYSQDIAAREKAKIQTRLAKEAVKRKVTSADINRQKIAMQDLRVKFNKSLPKGFQVSKKEFGNILSKEDPLEFADVLSKTLKQRQTKYIKSVFAINLDNKRLERAFDNAIRFVTNPSLIRNILYG